MITYNGKEYKRAIVFGDSHGCCQQVIELIHKVYDNLIEQYGRLDGYDPFANLWISVGDLTDRGPDSAELVQTCKLMNIQVVKGNHDNKWVRWRRNEQRKLTEPGYKNKMRPLSPHDLEEFAKLQDDDFTWLNGLPNYIEFGSSQDQWIVVHAGFLPDIPWRKQDYNIICRTRYIDPKTRKMIPYTKEYPSGGPDSIYWTDFWQGPEKVIYGHQVHDLNHVRKSNNGLCFGIDTGAYLGGHLTAMIIDSSNPEIDKISYQQVQCPVVPGFENEREEYLKRVV